MRVISLEKPDRCDSSTVPTHYAFPTYRTLWCTFLKKLYRNKAFPLFYQIPPELFMEILKSLFTDEVINRTTN